MNFLKNKEEFVKRVQDHKHEFVEKTTGTKLIRKRETTAPDRESAKAKLAKVSRIRIPKRNQQWIPPRKLKSPQINARFPLRIQLKVIMIRVHLHLAYSLKSKMSG